MSNDICFEAVSHVSYRSMQCLLWVMQVFWSCQPCWGAKLVAISQLQVRLQLPWFDFRRISPTALYSSHGATTVLVFSR